MEADEHETAGDAAGGAGTGEDLGGGAEVGDGLPADPPARSSPPMWAFVAVGVMAGLVLGASLIFVGGRFGSPEGETFEPLPGVTATLRPTAVAADGLVEAIRRSKRATFSLTEEFARLAPNGAEVVAARTVRIQRPPDSLVRTEGAVDLVVGGRHTACATAPDSGGQLQCRSEPAQPVDIDAAVSEQASMVRGPAPLYTVAGAGAGCYALVLRVERTAPPYGRRATLCYDALTGAPSRSEITKADGKGAEVVDRTVATDIRPTVGDEDLALPPGVTG